MGSKTSSQQNATQSQTTTTNPAAVSAYNTALGMASTAASKPYQAYTGELTAGINSQENTATSALNGLGAASTGYFNTAAQPARRATSAGSDEQRDRRGRFRRRPRRRCAGGARRAAGDRE